MDYMQYKEKTCRFGHECTSRCGNDIDCPCQADHCCALTEGCEGREHCDDHYEEKPEREFSAEQDETIEKLKVCQDIAHCFTSENGMCEKHRKEFDEDMKNARWEAEKELFEMVYNWGRAGIVTDWECNAFQKSLQKIRTF